MQTLLVFVTVAFICLVAATGCNTTNNSSELKYENLLMPLPIPGTGWKIASGSKPNVSVRVWKKADEKLQLMILHGKNQWDPQKWRTVVDDHARQDLTTTLESKTIKEGFANNYPMLLWETSGILNNGNRVQTLGLYIKGNDAAYSLIKTWFKTNVSAEAKMTWIDYLRSVKVVDNRYPEHAGPKMKSVDDPPFR